MSLKRRLAERFPFFVASELIYPRSYFAEVDDMQRALYARLADVVTAYFSPRSVVDVGCGTGLILARLAESGVEVQGVDGSRMAIRSSPISNRIRRWDLRRPLPHLGNFDLAICTEVAEHLPAQTAPILVAGLTRLSDRMLFTAATPGQGGRHHLNEQPHDYWEALFREQGYSRSFLDEEYIRSAVADIHQAPWIRENLMVYARD